jgi:uncharacterized protein (DUF1810 family)
MVDPFNLRRFLDAQATAYDQVVRELRTGQKRGHWMWYIFPQVKGLGKSPTSQIYAISSRNEASAYGTHAVLGPRLRQCTQLVIDAHAADIEQVFSYPDNFKFHSSITLFSVGLEDNQVFVDALRTYFDGKNDKATLDLLNLG